MRDHSFTSLLILLVLFFVLPSVLKFIGQYTLRSKNASREDIEMETNNTVKDQTESMEEYHSRERLDFHDSQPVSDRPINPKWF